MDLIEDMYNDREILISLGDLDIAKEYYAALCNMRWEYVRGLDDEERVVNRLKGERAYWSCSWRAAGGHIADLRNGFIGTNENYMDFYCSGNEGYVTDRVRINLERLGWEPRPWPQ